MHICFGKRNIIGSDNGLPLVRPAGRRQAIIWTNAGILLIEPFVTNFNEILIEIHTFSLTKFHLKMSSGKWRPFCLGLNVLMDGVTMTWPLLPLFQTPRSHFTKDLWAHKPNLVCYSSLKNDHMIRSQFCTCHDSLAAVTCANLWPYLSWCMGSMKAIVAFHH